MQSELGRSVWNFIDSQPSIIVGIDVGQPALEQGGITKWVKIDHEKGIERFLWSYGGSKELDKNDYQYRINIGMNTELVAHMFGLPYITKLTTQELALAIFHELFAHVKTTFEEWQKSNGKYDPEYPDADHEHGKLGNTFLYDTDPANPYRSFGIEAFGNDWWERYDPMRREPY